ncbi:MAG: cytochrome c oxidase assembly protein [Gammaproteobacteria bacterium]
MAESPIQAANKRLVKRLLYIVLGMFGFVFALVPLYGVLCDITGLNGKTTSARAAIVDTEPDYSRTVMVEFVALVNEQMPWEFKPVVARMEVHPGKTYQTSFYAKNTTEVAMTGQAIPSVAPGKAAKYFRKTECFCFTEQLFQAGEGRDMPLIFSVDKGLPKEVNELTLAYTFFDKNKQTNSNIISQMRIEE